MPLGPRHTYSVAFLFEAKAEAASQPTSYSQRGSPRPRVWEVVLGQPQILLLQFYLDSQRSCHNGVLPVDRALPESPALGVGVLVK